MAPTLVYRAKPAKRVIGADLAGAFDGRFGGGISPARRPRLPGRLTVSLPYLKANLSFSGEALVERWVKNVLWQFFGGTVQSRANQPTNQPTAHPPIR